VILNVCSIVSIRHLMERYSEAIIGRRGELAAALDSIPELRGTGIGIHDGENQVSTLIRPSNHDSRLTTFVVVEVVVDDVPTPDSMARGGSTNQVRYWTDDRGQRASVESMGLAFNCGGAILAGLSVVGSSAATAATAGAARHWSFSPVPPRWAHRCSAASRSAVC